jgi:protein-tyrosine-phosphatase/predicted ATP-grasp superfamily ATP-dependent carboligase
MLSNQPRPTGRVLVLGGDTRSFLSVVRSLGRAGLSVDSAWTAPFSLARRSRYLRHTNDDLPGYSPTGRHWLEMLRARVSEKQYDLVIPTSDPTILPLQACRSELDVRRFYLLEPRTFEITNDKTKTYELAVAERVPVPEQSIAHSADEAKRAASRFGFPLILKPFSSFNLESGMMKKQFVRRAENLLEFNELVPTMLSSGSIAIQPLFQGIGIGVELLAYSGKILACFQHERIHEPQRGGGSSYRKSVAINSELLKATERMIRALFYTGVCMVEFRFNPKTGEFILVEINGRFWGSLPLGIASGADFPLWLYQMWVEGRGEFLVKTQVGVYCRNLLSDWDWFGDNLIGNRTHTVRAAIGELATGLWRLVTLREHFDSFVWDDPAPGLAELRTLASRAVNRVHKFFLFSRFFSARRSLMRRRCVARLRSATRLVFVCKGNICRSPFAAECAKRILPGLQIHSAGYYSVANRPSPENAIAAAAQFSIDLSKSRSSVIDEDLLRRADVIFVFDYENYLTLCRAFDVQRSRVVFLGLFDDDPGFLDDPFDGSRQDFISTYSRISRAIANIGHSLRKSQDKGTSEAQRDDRM